ncbi:hypothetical protein V2L09_02520 [Pseudomonas alliivorans]|nr:hypothetical protein [Pseudomonas alliivorans]
MTVDIQKLKALADAAIEQEKRWKDAGEPWPIWNKCLLELQAAANPAVVLELCNNNESLRGLYQMHKQTETREMRDLKAELAGLKTGYEAYERVNAELRAENEALRQILSGSHEFILNDARTRHMCDETGQVSPLFPKRVGILLAIDTALSKGASHD